jgi:hypothetical protein
MTAMHELYQRVQLLIAQDQWTKEAFLDILLEAAVIDSSSIKWLFNEAKWEWIEDILTSDDTEYEISED